MSNKKFRWVGRNKKFNEIQFNVGLTTNRIMAGIYSSFFSTSNRGDLGNCEFIAEESYTNINDKHGAEIYEGDVVLLRWGVNEWHIGEVKQQPDGQWIVGNFRFVLWAHNHVSKVIRNIHEKHIPTIGEKVFVLGKDNDLPFVATVVSLYANHVLVKPEEYDKELQELQFDRIAKYED